MTKEHTLGVLRAARERLSDPANWHKGDYFPGFDADSVLGCGNLDDPQIIYHGATCFCILGVIGLVTNTAPGALTYSPVCPVGARGRLQEGPVDALYLTLRRWAESESPEYRWVRRVLGPYDISYYALADFNDADNTQHADVLRLFDETIERVEAEHD